MTTRTGQRDTAERRSWHRRLGDQWRRFAGDRKGATAVAFALVSVPVLLSMGGGIDMYRAYKLRIDLQDTVDSAVMAGSIKADESGSTTEAKTAVDTYIKQAFDVPTKLTTTKTTAVDEAKSIIKTTATVNMTTTFLRMIGKTTVPISASAGATYGGQLMEVSIALDVTGSMDGAKLAAAKAAAKDLTKTLFTVPGTNKKNEKVKIAVVPFAEYVNIDESNRGKTWLDTSGEVTKKECWNEYPDSVCLGYRHVKTTCTNDGTSYPCEWDECTGYSASKPVQVCQMVPHLWHGCVGSRSGTADLQAEASAVSKIPGLIDAWCNESLLRLSTNQGTVISKIEGLGAGGETYIAPGVLWAWRTLSSKLPFADGAVNGKSTKKAIILMTDGANTLSADPPWHWGRDVAASNDMLAKTCANAKADDIAIFTIAFEVTDTTIKNILKKCATAEPYFYDSTNSEQMKAAFARIGAQLSARRLAF